MIIDWSAPNLMVSVYISVLQCLFLPTWSRMATVADGLTDSVKYNLQYLAHKLDVVQVILGAPLVVHSMYRPPGYSVMVGGTATDVHTKGMACDFHVEGMSVETVKEVLLPLLEGLDMRMEQGTPSWIHLDTRAPGESGRYFKPFLQQEAAVTTTGLK